MQDSGSEDPSETETLYHYKGLGFHECVASHHIR